MRPMYNIREHISSAQCFAGGGYAVGHRVRGGWPSDSRAALRSVDSHPVCGDEKGSGRAGANSPDLESVHSVRSVAYSLIGSTLIFHYLSYPADGPGADDRGALSSPMIDSVTT